MFKTILTYRVVCFGKPAGPWRLRLTAARREAIAAGLGSYDEWGAYYDVVPGGIEIKEVSPRLLGLSDEQVVEMITSEKRARLSARQPQKVRHSTRFHDAQNSSNRGLGARGRI